MSLQIHNFNITSGNIVPSSQMDSYAQYVRVLLKFDGANGSTTFTDAKGHTFTPYGNAKISTTQSKFGGSSGDFDGTNDSIKTPDAPEFNLSTANFTMEAWVYFRQVKNYTMIAGKWSGFGINNGQCYALRINGSGQHAFAYTTNGVNNNGTDLSGTGSVAINVWQHWAVSRVGNTLKLFLDGNQIATGTISGSGTIYNSNANGFTLGGANNNTDCANAYIDDFRLTVGQARYTSNFTPPGSL